MAYNQTHIFRWIGMWLFTRTQRGTVEGGRPKDKRVLSGVPYRKLFWDLSSFYY